MNQILTMGQEPPKNKPEKKQTKVKKQKIAGTTQKAEINNVIRVFCIIIILLGISLIGKSTYGIATKKNSQKDNVEVSMDKMGKEVTVTINSGLPIKEYLYRWNDGEQSSESGNGKITISKTIQIPNGNNILNLKVIDYYGNQTSYKKQYIYESSDTVKPTVEMAITGKKLKITATDETKMYYVTYAWNEEQATRVDTTSSDGKTIEVEIEVPEGQNKLAITAVDKEENKTSRNENIIGDTKPTFTMSTDGENIIVTATDDEGISKISITLDGTTTDSGEAPINQKEITAKLPAGPGEHDISVTVTNINGLSDTQSLRASI